MASTSNYNAPTADIPYAAHVDTTTHPATTYAEAAQPPVKGAVAHGPPVYVVAIPHVAMQQQANEWKIDFCGCFGAPLHCCGAFFFPCLNAAYAAHHIGWSALLIGIIFAVVYVPATVLEFAPSANGGYWFSLDTTQEDYNYYNTESTISIWNVIGTACTLAFIVATCMLRRAVRSFDHIPGSTITDVCASIWCSCCVLSQLSAHTERVKPIRAANAATLPAYHAA